jgi:adenylate cyclase
MAALSTAMTGVSWDDRIGDNYFKLRYALFGSRPVDPSISIVGLADDDEDALGLAGGSREPFAVLVKTMSSAGVELAIMDIAFPDRGGKEGDQAFSSAVHEAGNVFLPVILRPKIPVKTWPTSAGRPGDPVVAVRLVGNYPALDAAALGFGHVNSMPDSDGTFRRMPMVIRHGEALIPCLSLRVACTALGVDPSRIEVVFGRHIRLPDAIMRDGRTTTIDIPIDTRGMAVVDLPGSWASSFTYYPFAGIVAAGKDPELMESVRTELYGAKLVVADLTTATSDYGPTVYDGVYPLAGMHAAMLDSILASRFVRRADLFESLLWLVLLAAMVWMASMIIRPTLFVLLTLGAWTGMALAQFVIFKAVGVLPALAAPSTGMVLSIIAINVYKYLGAEKARVHLRSRMERYFAPALISRIMREQDRLMVAERKVVTVLFSDIAGFTSWCTTKGPDEIHRTLNNYFELMTEIVFRHEGTVDKFIGDGLMAFFGDPVEQPDQAFRAVKVAIEMQQALVAARMKPEAEDSLRMHIRIGINSGEVIVGDMGSRRIMAYTAIGSNVNLGSRLESKAPIDGILVSEPVFRAVDGLVATRYTGKTSAKGIPDEFDVWEVMVPDLL